MVGNRNIFWLWGGQVIQLRERCILGDWRGGGHYGVRLQGPRMNTQIILKFKLAWLFVLFTWRFHCSFNIEQLCLIMRWFFSGFPIVERRHGGWEAPPLLRNFFEPPYQKTDARHGAPATPDLKMKPPTSEKQLPPLKHETPFPEMIPRKSTINNNLKLVSAIFY